MNKESNVMAVVPWKVSEGNEAVWSDADQERQRALAAVAQRRLVWQIGAAALCAVLAAIAAYIAQ